MYAEHGIGALEKLRGPFAVALWDSQSGELTLARDRLGERPLYFFDCPDFFASHRRYGASPQLCRQAC
ncbi:hypothetical protein ID875_30635 [Streptomyces globisporus]|uniref:asparagine synthase (glutamine-hydrolyzing) n=1 Tax=Streptomyces globisporus TaxID=1908 RepID=A0A927BMU1_STRGL|nr:hypothetical protein [Streptomyces globisporus]